MKEEIWKTIPGWEGLYEASSLGRIRSVDRNLPRGRWGHVFRRGHIISPSVTALGYLKVGLRNGDGRQHFGVHRLVCLAFHGVPPSPEMQTAHFPDPTRTNNTPDNLAWVTPQGNQSHRALHGTDPAGERNGSARLSEAQVREIRSRYQPGRPRHPGNQDALAAEYGICPGYVGAVAKGKSWAYLN